MNSFHIVERREQPTAGVRDRVPMADLSGFFSRAFGETMAAISAQGAHASGPPFGKYYGRPDAFVDVEAGFPVATPIEPAGDVVPGFLPGGRVVEAVHVGPFDTMGETYAQLERDMQTRRLNAEAIEENYVILKKRGPAYPSRSTCSSNNASGRAQKP
jgi:hypothetical protein